MTTFVGTQGDFADALKALVELDFDAVEAYDAAINRLDDDLYIKKLTEFRDDHKRHIKELSEVLDTHKEDAPETPSGKQWLTKGKVILADLIDKEAILSAMKSNECDTNTAYERMMERTDKWADAEPVLLQGFQDEKRHKEWFEKNTHS